MGNEMEQLRVLMVNYKQRLDSISSDAGWMNEGIDQMIALVDQVNANTPLIVESTHGWIDFIIGELILHSTTNPEVAALYLSSGRAELLSAIREAYLGCLLRDGKLEDLRSFTFAEIEADVQPLIDNANIAASHILNRMLDKITPQQQQL